MFRRITDNVLWLGDLAAAIGSGVAERLLGTHPDPAKTALRARLTRT
jgi:hypothetical protein